MAWCNSTLTIDMSKLKRLDEASKRALEQTAEALHTEIISDQVMPFDTGNMQNENTFVDTSKRSDGKVGIVTSTPYARKMYYHPEYDFRKTNNPNAKGEWLESYVSGSKKDFAKKAFTKLYKKEAGL